LTRSPILRALSTIQKNGVRTLLMGGQACVFYGAAEFSRDLDLLVLANPGNLDRLQSALDELAAIPIAIPPFRAEYLAKGHAVHFRCFRDDVNQLRIDVMSLLRGVASFEELWERRETILSEEVEVDLMSIADLVRAKKTQRNKDWPMIQRLVERHYAEFRFAPSEEQILFWLRELRTPELLREVIERYPELAGQAKIERSALTEPLGENLRKEEDRERLEDREYWRPLREELERLRFERRSGK